MKNKPIRVLHFIPAFSKVGGVESLVKGLHQYINKNEIQFDYLIETPYNLQDFDDIKKLGGNIYRIKPLNKKFIFKYILNIKKFFYENHSKFDIVHCHNIERAFFVLYFAKKFGIKYRIFHAHNDSVDDARYPFLAKKIIYLNNLLSTHFFACSKAAGEFYFKSQNKKFIVLPNSIDVKKFCFSYEKRIQIRNDLNINEKAFVIGHTGRFSYQKNHKKIINIFKRIVEKIDNSYLILVGDGPLKSKIELQVKQLGLKEKVIFTGPKNNVNEYLNAFDIFLLPSFFEGFSISLLEAQANSLKCVTSHIIQEEVKVSDLIIPVSLYENDDKWCEIILSHKDYTRDSYVCNKLLNTFYDHKKNANYIKELYMQIIKKDFK